MMVRKVQKLFIIKVNRWVKSMNISLKQEIKQ